MISRDVESDETLLNVPRGQKPVEPRGCTGCSRHAQIRPQRSPRNNWRAHRLTGLTCSQLIPESVRQAVKKLFTPGRRDDSKHNRRPGTMLQLKVTRPVKIKTV